MLTSHLIKTLKQLFLSLLRPQVMHVQDPLQFTWCTEADVEDAILSSALSPHGSGQGEHHSQDLIPGFFKRLVSSPDTSLTDHSM